MMDTDDIDINLLSELLDQAENDDKDEPTSVSAVGSTSAVSTATSKQERSESQTFESVLEDLDRIPVKVSSRSTLSDQTSLFNNHEATKKRRSSGVEGANSSAIHTGDTDSSDDEDARQLGSVAENFGTSVKRMMKSAEQEKREGPRLSDLYDRKPTWKQSITPSSPSYSASLALPAKKKISSDVYTDPTIGIRIVNPLVSSTVMKDRLVGRKVISMVQVKQFTSDNKISDDWVIFGVIVSKAPPRTSAKGTLYSIIKISDLRGPGNPKTVSLFLFSSAFKKHGKDSLGTVIGILNPGVMDNSRNHGDEACLSVDNADRVMTLGTSKDFGLCKSKKKNGENCTSVVNTALCEYCVYHVKQEYTKCSTKRSDIQSSFNGPGLSNLRNKVLGKNEVFYGGQSFSAVPAKKNKKLVEKDQSRLSALSGMSQAKSTPGLKPPVKSGLAACVELGFRQSQKDLDRLRKLSMDDANCLSKPSSSSVVTAQFNPKEVKPDDSKHAALTLIASKKKELEARSSDLNLSENEGNSSDKSLSVCKERSSALTISKDAEIMSENVTSSRGIQATLALTKKKQNSGGMTPSSLGLGRASSKSENTEVSQESKSSSLSTPQRAESSSKIREKTREALTTSRTPLRNAGKKPSTPKLSSDQLKKLTDGMDLESRMLKQAAQKAAQEEEAAKCSVNATPSMLGLGRTSGIGMPKLGSGLTPSSTIDLNAPISKKISNAAKLNAINLIRYKGGISKKDPNPREFESRKKTTVENRRHAVKRSHEETSPPSKDQDIEAKKRKFKELLEATSSHTELIEAAENEAQDEYFGKLEKKEQMEEKMLNTFKVACKAVRCLTCKYTSFSASERCKTERHPLKVMDATKRFFKCGDCGNRTVSLQVIPLVSCSNCNSSRWERAAMIRERKVGITQDTLSVRGMEETFIGSVTTGANINLLVPDEGTSS